MDYIHHFLTTIFSDIRKKKQTESKVCQPCIPEVGMTGVHWLVSEKL